MILWVIRALYLIVLAGLAAKITTDYGNLVKVTVVYPGVFQILLFSGIIGLGLLPLIFDLMYKKKDIRTISAIYFGLLVGSLLGHLLNLAFGPTLVLLGGQQLNLPFAIVATVLLCYTCVSVLLQTKDDFRFIIPYVEFARESKGGRPMILDTSVIIDGRIADIADTGVLANVLVVPQFVLQELQYVADSPDRMRRNRGRRGLDVVDRLMKCQRVEVDTPDLQVDPNEARDVDAKLLVVTKRLNGKLVTNDVNLAKLAKIHEIETININEVSNAAKPPVLWGEVIVVRLVKEGEEPGQGIGYLEDGTMVVAEMGKNYVGTEVNLIVTSVLQTNAGRMVFGKIDFKNPEPHRPATQSRS